VGLFASKREKRLWWLAGATVVALLSTVPYASSLAEKVDLTGVADTAWISGLIVTALAVGVIIGGGFDLVTIGGMVGLTAALYMALVRMATVAERTHLFEYGLLAALIYSALVERRAQRATVARPALLAIAITGLLGWLDELLQLVIPDRTYDVRDVGFNLLAATLTVAAAATITALRGKRSELP
jgi:VanZ family protein